MNRTKLFSYVKKEYKTIPEYPWKRYPDYAVLRHMDGNKLYGVVMNVRKSVFGYDSEDYVEILNVKCSLEDADFFKQIEGILPAYHMNKEHWVSILLDGTVDDTTIKNLLDTSYQLTQGKNKTGKIHNTTWIVPANPKFYDIEAAFAKEDIIIWKQSNDIWVGDIVYLYVASPVSAIRYKCKAVEVNIPYQYEDENLSLRKAMRIQKLKEYDNTIDFSMLKEYGVYAVRGPRSMPKALEEEMEHRFK